MSEPAHAIRPFRCPRCGRTVLWLDGESSPSLLYEGGLPSSCEACHGKKLAPSAPRVHPAARERFRNVRPPRPPDSRPPARTAAQIMRDDVRGVVGLALDVGNDLVDAAVAVRKLLRKLKG